MTPLEVLRIDLERLESIKVDSNRVKWTKFTQNTLKMIRNTRGMQNNDVTCQSIGLILKVMNGVEVISNRFKMNGIEWKQVELI
jgi:hypothetical protein